MKAASRSLMRNITCTHHQGKITANKYPMLLYIIFKIIFAVGKKIEPK